MILMKPSAVLEAGPRRDEAMRILEAAGRTCYKSEEKRGDAVQRLIDDREFEHGSHPELRLVAAHLRASEDFIRRILAKGHESVLEHVSWTIRFICDRGVTHELVRHRLCAFSQESTRYVDYAGKKAAGHCQFIIPPWVNIAPGTWEHDGGPFRFREAKGAQVEFDDNDPVQDAMARWLMAMDDADDHYRQLRALNWSPQQARAVLPNSTKTEIVVTANAREWRHIARLRTGVAAHPQMKEVMDVAVRALAERAPVLFEGFAAQLGEAPR